MGKITCAEHGHTVTKPDRTPRCQLCKRALKEIADHCYVDEKKHIQICVSCVRDIARVWLIEQLGEKGVFELMSIE